MKQVLFGLLTIIILSSFVVAVQPTQEQVNIPVIPFSFSTVPGGINVSAPFIVQPPDGISKTIAAIFVLDVWQKPPLNISLWINGRLCNTPYYYINSTFASAGEAQVKFDCSNIINSSGIYNLTADFSNTTGAGDAYLQLTYVTSPGGSTIISGTEYSPGDNATIFLQLTDSNNLPVTNASCTINIWSPNNASNVHPVYLQNAPMINAIGQEGMYYYDLTAPSTLGNYMVSANCGYSYNYIWLYPTTDLTDKPSAVWSSTGHTGNLVVLNDPSNGQYVSFNNPLGTLASVMLEYNITNLVNQLGLNNITSINTYFMGQSSSTGTLTEAYYNGTKWINLTNTLSLNGQSSNTAPLNTIDQVLSNVVPSSAIVTNGSQYYYLIELNATSTGLIGTYTIYYKWIASNFLTAYGTAEDVAGSSEMHITNIPNATDVLVNVSLQPILNNQSINSASLLGNLSNVLGNLSLMQSYDRGNYSLILGNQSLILQSQQGNFSLIENSLGGNFSLLLGNDTWILGNLSQMQNWQTGNFTLILGNQTQIQGNLTIIESSLQSNFSSINQSLFNIYSLLQAVNASTGNTNLTFIYGNLSQIQSQLITLQLTQGGNFSYVLGNETIIQNQLGFVLTNLTFIENQLTMLNVTCNNCNFNETNILNAISGVSTQVSNLQISINNSEQSILSLLNQMQYEINWMYSKIRTIG